MKKELDKELYPDYVYPEFTPDPNEPFREPIAKLGQKDHRPDSAETGIEKDYQKRSGVLGTCRRAYR